MSTWTSYPFYFRHLLLCQNIKNEKNPHSLQIHHQKNIISMNGTLNWLQFYVYSEPGSGCKAKTYLWICMSNPQSTLYAIKMIQQYSFPFHYLIFSIIFTGIFSMELPKTRFEIGLTNWWQRKWETEHLCLILRSTAVSSSVPIERRKYIKGPPFRGNCLLIKPELKMWQTQL